MHTYYGTDGASIVAVNLPSKGVWSFPKVPDDGNDRDAFTVGDGIEACQNSIVWLYYHQVDGLIGGEYPGDFEWTGDHQWSEGGLFGDDVQIIGDLGVSGNAEVLNALTVGGNATFENLLTAEDQAIFGDVVTRVGDTAYESGRKGTGPNATTTVDVWKKDLWTVTLTDDRVWTLSHPPNDEIVETTIYLKNPEAGFQLELGNVGAMSTFAELSNDSGAMRSVIVRFDGDDWLLTAGVRNL